MRLIFDLSECSEMSAEVESSVLPGSEVTVDHLKQLCCMFSCHLESVRIFSYSELLYIHSLYIVNTHCSVGSHQAHPIGI